VGVSRNQRLRPCQPGLRSLGLRAPSAARSLSICSGASCSNRTIRCCWSAMTRSRCSTAFCHRGSRVCREGRNLARVIASATSYLRHGCVRYRPRPRLSPIASLTRSSMIGLVIARGARPRSNGPRSRQVSPRSEATVIRRCTAVT